MHVEIASSKGKICDLTTIYASSCTSIRKLIWGMLDEMKIEYPWLIIGDFNGVLRGEERSFGQGVSNCFVN